MTTAILVTLLVSTQLSAAAARPQSDKTWFQNETQTLMNAVAPGDRSVWDRVLAPNCVITDEDGGVSTKAQFLAELHPLPPGFSGTIVAQDLTVAEFGDAAVVHYWLDEHETVFTQHLHTRYVVTATYRRTGDTWRMVAMQSTVVQRDLAPHDQHVVVAETRRQLRVQPGGANALPRLRARRPALRRFRRAVGDRARTADVARLLSEGKHSHDDFRRERRGARDGSHHAAQVQRSLHAARQRAASTFFNSPESVSYETSPLER